METFYALLVLCEGIRAVTGEFNKRPVTRSFDVFFDLCLNSGLTNNRGAGGLRRHRPHYDVVVVESCLYSIDLAGRDHCPVSI